MNEVIFPVICAVSPNKAEGEGATKFCWLPSALIVLLLSACSPKYTTITPELHSQMMGDLKTGTLNLNCQFECDWSWLGKFNEMVALHNAKQWESLAVLVMQVGHEKDIAYYFLGRSAEGLGYNQAAKTYYQRSAELSGDNVNLHHCRSLDNGCARIDLASVLPTRLASLAAHPKSNSASSNLVTKPITLQLQAHTLDENNPKGVLPITEKILLNSTLNLSAGDGLEYKIHFKNGADSNGKGNDDPEFYDAWINMTAFGDLNGDKIIDAVAVSVITTGGSGIFYSFSTLIAAPGRPVATEPVFLGDRVDIQSLKIQSTKIILKAVLQGPDDRPCCPTKKTTLTYAINNGSLSLQK